MKKKHPPHTSSSSFEKRLAEYGAMSLAIAGARVGSPAQAKAVYWNGQGATEAVNGPGVEFNFFTGAVGTTAVVANGVFGLNVGSSNNLFGPFVRGNKNSGLGGKIFDAPASGAISGPRVGPFNPSHSQLATLGYCSALARCGLRATLSIDSAVIRPIRFAACAS